MTAFGSISAEKVRDAARHVHDIVRLAVMHDAAHAALVVYDRRSDLATTLEHAYRQALPDARFVDFDAIEPADVMAAFETLAPGSLVVLIHRPRGFASMPIACASNCSSAA